MIELPGQTARYFLKIAYRGSAYRGWQKQPHGNTIQDHIERAFHYLYKPIKLYGSSRTDRGVHATGQVAHVDLAPIAPPKLLYSLNALLPSDIVITRLAPVLASAHARYSALSRSYRYTIYKRPNALASDLGFFCHTPLAIEPMNRAAAHLVGLRSFASFCKNRRALKHHFCHIKAAWWEEDKVSYRFFIEGNRFLQQMVRAVAACLVEVGRGKLSLEELEEIIAAQDRCRIKHVLPAHGLCLTHVTYPETLWLPTKDSDSMAEQSVYDLEAYKQSVQEGHLHASQ